MTFAALVYFYYAAAVILAMAAFGFAIGSGLVLALGIGWSWVAVLAGLAVGAILGLASVLGNLPMVVLAVVSSIAGAVCVVAGLMLLVGSLNSADFTENALAATIPVSLGWDVTLVVLALTGIIAQTRARATMRRDIHETWNSGRR